MKRRIFVTCCLIFIISRLAACNTADISPVGIDTPAAATVAPTAATIPPIQILTATPKPTLSEVEGSEVEGSEVEGSEVEGSEVEGSTPTRSAPSPTPTPHLYVVQQYDTLLGIALEFDTTVEALLAANGIKESDFLQIGQELIIPAPGQAVTPLAAVSPATTVTLTPTAALTATTPVTSTPALSEVEGSEVEGGQSATPSPSPTSALPNHLTTQPPNISHPANINPLTGLAVDDPAQLQRRPLLVRVGNDPAARPQVGLNSADMVYEEIAEWWVTRFTAIFLAQTPTTIGPVRSARLINVQLVPQYQGALAHSGGSDPVRWEISQAPIVNLDEYYNRLPYFYRPNEGWQTRLAIDAEAARAYLQKKGLDTPVSLHGFLFSDTLEGGESGPNIFIPYPRVTSLTEWHYDPASSKYLRWISGQPLYDANGGQVAASNVIIYFAEHQKTDIVEDTNGATSIRILVNGQGPAWFFRDGQLNKGFWQTDGSRTPYFAYADGRPYALKPGNTWVEVVPTTFTIGLNSFDEASTGK